MFVIQATPFKNSLKKLHKNQKQDLDQAIKKLMKDPLLGDPKVGDLAQLRVFKFKMVGQLTLLAYTYNADIITLTLLALGSHENFYRDLKR